MTISRRDATAPHALRNTQRGSMPKPSASEVTRLLIAWSAGDQSALQKLAPPRRRRPDRLAEAHMSRERPGHTPPTG